MESPKAKTPLPIQKSTDFNKLQNIFESVDNSLSSVRPNELEANIDYDFADQFMPEPTARGVKKTIKIHRNKNIFTDSNESELQDAAIRLSGDGER